MTDREKIIKIIESNKLCVLDMDCNGCPYRDNLNKTGSCGSYILADALIAAGIGDVSAVKAEQEEIKLLNAEIKNGEIDMTVGSEWFKTFFALIAQIFKQNGASAFLTTTIEGGNDIKYAVTIQRVGEKSPAEELRQVTELWKHEEHCAEVAERQAILLSKWLAEKTRKDYPWQAWFDEAQKQAQKELAEERKDG